ncbi:MAG: DHH family phosphoesterase [Fibrobacter sp.]|nr:DHH family phosphoesterase [Fibrobacter sp.]
MELTKAILFASIVALFCSCDDSTSAGASSDNPSAIDTVTVHDTIMITDTIIQNENLHYKDAIRAIKWGTEITYTIGHTNPDVDAIFSAIAYAALMESLGYNVEARMAPNTNSAAKFFSDTWDIELPQVLENASDLQLILVDHNEYLQALPGTENAKILQIIDHHGIGSVTEANQIVSKMLPVGSTCSIIYTSFKELGVSISEKLAKVMLAGIISDTKNLTKVGAVTGLDTLAYRELVEIAGITDTASIYRQMQAAERNYNGMTDKEILNSDAKDYSTSDKSYNYRIGNLDWYDQNTLEAFMLRMVNAMKDDYNNATTNSGAKLDMVFAKIDMHSPDSENEGEFIDEGSYIVYYGSLASQMMFETFGSEGYTKLGDYDLDEAGIYYSEEKMSRKVLQPKLNETFEQKLVNK